MICPKCHSTFSSRPQYLVHSAKCSTGTQEDDEISSSSEKDDSDADPWWSPGSEADDDIQSSPLSADQIRIAAEMEKALIDIPFSSPPPSPIRLADQEINTTPTRPRSNSDIPLSSPPPSPIRLADQEINTTPTRPRSNSNQESSISWELKKKLENIQLKINDWKLKRKAAFQHGKKGAGRRLTKNIQKHNELLKTMRREVGNNEVKDTEQELIENTPTNAEQLFNKQKRKKNYCLYCEKLVSKFSEHIEKVHKDKEEGLKLASVQGPKLEKRLKKQKITDPLRKKWNFAYNEKVLRENSTANSLSIPTAALIPVKRKSIKTKRNEKLQFLTCSSCLGLYRRDKLSVHMKSCSAFVDNNADFKLQAIKQHSITITPHSSCVSDEFKEEILKGINVDDIMEAALQDKLIMTFINKFHKSRREPASKHYVIREMRDLGKLYLKIKQKNQSIKTFSECLNPVNFSTMVEAALDMAGYCKSSGSVKVPSVAYRLCQPVKDAANILLTENLKDFHEHGGDRRPIVQLQDFLLSMEINWKSEIGRICTKKTKFDQADKKELMALEKDIITLASHLEGKYRKLIQTIKTSNLKNETYDELSHTLVSHIMLLVRRRPVDFKNAQIKHYKNLDVHDELLEMATLKDLSAEEMKICKKFHIFYVPGKNLTSVPMVLTPLMKDALETLLMFRKDVGIEESNETLFLLSMGKLINPVVSLRLMAKEVKLIKPSHLTGNGLRHQAATFSRLHSTHPQYQDYLASLMGHSLMVHKKNYQLPVGIIQKLNVVPVLHNVMTGNKTTAENETRTNQLSNDNGDHSENDNNCLDFPDNFSSNEDRELTFSTPEKKKRKIKWTEKEQGAVFNYFGKDILNKKIPPRSEIVTFKAENKEVFQLRSIAQIQMFIRNHSLRAQKNVTPKIKRFLNKNKQY